MKRIITTIAMMIILTICISIRAKAESTDAVEKLIEEFKNETCCDSVSVAVYEKGEVTYYGDEQSLYQIGSMTKAFTGLAIEHLIDEGLISKDDTVSDHIPGFEVYYNDQKVDISIDDLMMQRSGFTNSEKDYPSATIDMTLTEWIYNMSGKSLKSLPGSEYSYSNANFNILGAIIESVTGRSYREYMENEILKPLGLDNTYVGIPYDEKHIITGTRLAYRNTFEYDIPVREASIPAGYFYSNIKDMSRWLGIWTGGADVSPDLKASIDNIKRRMTDTGDYYSGWERFSDEVIGHSGGTPNFSSRIVFLDKDDIGVCVLTNLNVSASTDSLCNGIIDIVKGKDHAVISGDVWTVFDIIFTIITLVSFILFISVFLIHKRTILIGVEIVLVLLLITMIIVLPLIFKATLRDILLIWAPGSLIGGLVVMSADASFIALRLVLGKNNANRNKTSGGSTLNSYN